MAKEVDYQFRLRESEEEQRFKKLDEMIRNQQKAREEIAASRERRHFFKRKRKEKNLKKGAKAFDLLQQIKKYANACFEQGTPEYEAVIHSVSILEKNFEPYSIQFKKIRDEKQQKELVAKETCAREGHTGEWHEHEYTVWAICGDRGFERYCPITKKNWTRICTRCREQETVDVEPIEVTRLHKLQEINDMEEKLKQMKSE